ncbi:MAG: esterase/lipase family protein [Alphaproteobacteria bacterium]
MSLVEMIEGGGPLALEGPKPDPAAPITRPGFANILSEARVAGEIASLAIAWPALQNAPKGDGHPVLVLPGFSAGDTLTLALRRYLRGQGYRAHAWRLGVNMGPSPARLRALGTRFLRLQRDYGQKVSLIGWSMGGIYARELARLYPDQVRQVITLGSPFGAHPRDTSIWPMLQAAFPQVADKLDDDLFSAMRVAPPVPTTAVWSKRDGVVPWGACVEQPGRQTENIEIQGSHIGFTHNPAALFAVADRLAQHEGEWQKFNRSGLRRLVYLSASA